jgi:AraC-like DNA-binding protein
MVALLAADGAPEEDVLRDTGLDGRSLRDPSCLTSMDQYWRICSNGIGLTGDPSLAFRSGAALHLSDWGLLGLLLQSCTSSIDYCQLRVKYQSLAAPSLSVDWIETAREVVWVWPNELSAHSADPLKLFLREQHTVEQVTQLRDLLGPECHPSLAAFAHPAPPHRDLYSEYLGCHCVFDHERSELHYAKSALSRRPLLANPMAVQALQAACNRLLADMEARRGTAGKVHRALSTLNDPGASMKLVASALGMTDRTLRRRLAAEGTSFSAIVHRLQYSVAIQHLRDRQLTVEQIAIMAGFSDSTSFRRAFMRWTSMSPAQFRRLGLM